MRLEISLPDHSRPALDEQVVRGKFTSHSEYVESLTRQEQERLGREQPAQTEQLEAMLLARVESGEPVEMTRNAWSDLRAKLISGIAPGTAK